jgi:hypothetical protein
VAISSAMYCCSEVTLGSMRQKALRYVDVAAVWFS